MINEELRREALHEINILTTPTEQEIRRIDRILQDGIEILNRYAGIEVDYKENNMARNLLLAFVRYEYNGSGEYFEHNYNLRLNAFIDEVGLNEYEKSNPVTEVAEND